MHSINGWDISLTRGDTLYITVNITKDGEPYTPAETDVIRFAIASYNVGGGALARRRAEADSLGLNRNSWADVATIFDREDHTTPGYISAVEETYAKYCSRVR